MVEIPVTSYQAACAVGIQSVNKSIETKEEMFFFIVIYQSGTNFAF